MWISPDLTTVTCKWIDRRKTNRVYFSQQNAFIVKRAVSMAFPYPKEVSNRNENTLKSFDGASLEVSNSTTLPTKCFLNSWAVKLHFLGKSMGATSTYPSQMDLGHGLGVDLLLWVTASRIPEFTQVLCNARREDDCKPTPLISNQSFTPLSMTL